MQSLSKIHKLIFKSTFQYTIEYTSWFYTGIEDWFFLHHMKKIKKIARDCYYLYILYSLSLSTILNARYKNIKYNDRKLVHDMVRRSSLSAKFYNAPLFCYNCAILHENIYYLLPKKLLWMSCQFFTRSIR